MRVLLAATLVVLSVACGAAPIQNLQLSWKGVSDLPRVSATVGTTLANVPIALGVRDVRADPTAVGVHEDINHVVRTRDNVAQYASAQIGEMLRVAGARFENTPAAYLEVDLVEFRVNEGGRFIGLAVLRVAVRRGDRAEWSKTYQGTSKRWGRSYSPDNFNEALSNALAEAVAQMVVDDSFAFALSGSRPAPGPPPPPSYGGPPGT